MRLACIVVFLFSLAATAAFAHTQNGTDGHNWMVGHEGHGDTLNGLGGSDDIFGRGHNDDLRGADGEDNVNGETDDDVVRGGAHADNVEGDGGHDTVIAGTHRDNVKGGDDSSPGLGRDDVQGEEGDDDILVFGDFGNSPDEVHGGADVDSCFVDGFGSQSHQEFSVDGCEEIL